MCGRQAETRMWRASAENGCPLNLPVGQMGMADSHASGRDSY